MHRHALRRYVRHASTRVRPKWYHSTDAPVSMPRWYEYEQKKTPEKFVPFSDHDNARLEASHAGARSAVDVKEDRLFRVDLDRMQLSPIYWNGPVYEVRRGTWFTTDGRPLAADTTQVLEAAYHDLRMYAKQAARDVPSKTRVLRDLTAKFNHDVAEPAGAAPAPSDVLDIDQEDDVVAVGGGQAAIFFDDTYAALFPASLSRLQVNIIRSLQPKYASLMSVVPVQRGCSSAADASILDQVKSANVASLTDIFSSEVASLFTKDSPSVMSDSKKPDQARILEDVIHSDYGDAAPVSSKRKINHLVLCVHGIGQLLGHKYESVNFTHSINVLRKTMRDVFQNERKYQQLAHGADFDPENAAQRLNNTIQALPVSWRHSVSFHPRQPMHFDSEAERNRLPSLSQINVEGVRPLRNIVGDVVLDLLLFYEPVYLKQIMAAVSTELNAAFRKYKEQNPDFDGKVHLFGHSLGSAICYNLLSQQDGEGLEQYKLDFDVDNLFCVGSPVGMFELLKQRNIRPRSDVRTADISLEASFSSPKCNNLYNVFHPCDPVSYRMEPLVHPSFANMKPEAAPFALEGLNTKVQNLTSLGDDFSEKISSASSWFLKKSAKSGSAVDDENALGDIITSLTSSGSPKNNVETKTETLDQKDLDLLLKLNRTGRIDYSLPMGVFSIALVSAISAHVSYFEDEETAGFIMREILSSEHDAVKSKKVAVYSS